MNKYNPENVSINEPPLTRDELINIGLEKTCNFEIPEIPKEKREEVMAEVEALRKSEAAAYAAELKNKFPIPDKKFIFENFNCAGITDIGIKKAWELVDDRRDFYTLNKNIALCGTTQSGKSTRMLSALLSNYNGERLFVNNTEITNNFWAGKTKALCILWIDWVKACRRTYWQVSAVDKNTKPFLLNAYKYIFIDDFGHETKDMEALENFRNFVWEQHAKGAIFIMTTNATDFQEYRGIFRNLFLNPDPVFERCGTEIIFTKMFSGVKYK